jgi:hypothetical protein
MLIYAKRVSQLVYNKLKEIEEALIIAKNNFDKDEINESEFSESDNEEEVEEEEEKKFQNLKLELVNLERQTMKSKIVNIYVTLIGTRSLEKGGEKSRENVKKTCTQYRGII